ncbi:MAG TPA: response regulator [Ktedonosporobacter sp.]|nr:response regulator [Ktedonosporobacter sp.]
MLEQSAFTLEKHSTRHKTILVVDDDSDFRTCLVQILQEETPYHVVFASDAFEALRLIGQLHCDLFLLDYQLPGIDGLDLYDLLRSTPGHEAVAAICISASSRLSKHELAKRNLICLHKPLELDDLLKEIQRLIGAAK